MAYGRGCARASFGMVGLLRSCVEYQEVILFSGEHGFEGVSTFSLTVFFGLCYDASLCECLYARISPVHLTSTFCGLVAYNYVFPEAMVFRCHE